MVYTVVVDVFGSDCSGGDQLGQCRLSLDDVQFDFVAKMLQLLRGFH
jgi:hypothetical protein